MPISGPGSKTVCRRVDCAADPRGATARGFTLIELLIVIAIVALSASIMTLALRDSSATRLEEEGARLVALLEMARAEARVAGSTVRWVPGGSASGNNNGNSSGNNNSGNSNNNTAEAHFSFVGLGQRSGLPNRWLDAGTRAQVNGAVFVVLGPEAILPPQRVVLSLGPQRLEVATDGLGPFAVAGPATADR